MDIETPRLILRLVPLAGLAATGTKDLEACRRIIGRKLTEEWFEDSWVADMRLEQWQKDPAYAPWSIRAIALKDTGEIAGTINCHDLPRPFDLDGEAGLVVETGYTIFPDWRRKGLGYEAVTGLAGFAVNHGVRWLRLSISPGNDASLRLAQKLGAYQIGSQIDEIDGPEDIYLVDL
jgi:[ribosomal protein S5]-alanine N-acetyltransferase